jgi:2-polyprenyl-3-methyl-5-hydroxy-6-metoxy-1,4-benzoquinol methylase
LEGKELETVSVTKEEVYAVDSEIFTTSIGKKYLVTTEVCGEKGKSNSSFFGVINLDKNNKEVERKVTWLNDFSNTRKKYHIVFEASTSQVIFIYRINKPVPVQSNVILHITKLNDIVIQEVDSVLEKQYEGTDFLSLIPKDITKEKALQRWQIGVDGPSKGLTWGRYLTGDNFVKLSSKYNIFGKNKSILELGPGYGRILSSLLSHKIPFKEYIGIDISEKNIKFLQEKFKNKNIHFKHGDFSTIELDKKYDVVISSAVLKHQYPTFTPSLKNIQKFVHKDGIFFFDVRENIDNNLSRDSIEELLEFGPHKSNWDTSTNTFVGFYTTNEIKLILKKISQELIAFDHVIHDESMGSRLIVVSKKK